MRDGLVYLACLLVIFVIGAAFLSGWVLLMLYIESLGVDNSHNAIAAGFTIGWLVPIGCTLGVVLGAWALKENL